jgi:hypothetical protein
MVRKSLVLTLLACSLFAIGADAAQVTHVTARGDVANASWAVSTSNTFSQTNVEAQRTDSSTFLIIFSFGFDVTTSNVTFLQGVGFVPDANFSVNADMATISTELANDPDFTLTRTVEDQFGNIISQTTISSGSINISLKKNRSFSSSFTGIQRNTFGNFIELQQLDGMSVSASASGTFLGSAVPSDALGDIGTNRSNFITIIKN